MLIMGKLMELILLSNANNVEKIKDVTFHLMLIKHPCYNGTQEGVLRGMKSSRNT